MVASWWVKDQEHDVVAEEEGQGDKVAEALVQGHKGWAAVLDLLRPLH